MSSKYNYFYLIEIQYLGFRYHGWQIQGNLKTIQRMLGKTINFIWPKTWKILASGRTDAMVSARSSYFELFTKEPIDIEDFFNLMNKNLPADISFLSIKEVDDKFNVINHVKSKTYQYFFSFGADKYPLAASLISHFNGALDMVKMGEAAKLFEGEHDFKEFMKDVKAGSKTIRKIDKSIIKKNEELKANFFPPNSYIYEVKGKGFARHQIRLMMGALVQVGRGDLTLDQISRSLKGETTDLYKFLAPASGLMVKEVLY